MKEPHYPFMDEKLLADFSQTELIVLMLVGIALASAQRLVRRWRGWSRGVDGTSV